MNGAQTATVRATQLWGWWERWKDAHGGERRHSPLMGILKRREQVSVFKQLGEDGTDSLEH